MIHLSLRLPIPAHKVRQYAAEAAAAGLTLDVYLAASVERWGGFTIEDAVATMIEDARNEGPKALASGGRRSRREC